jgi:hypothetical protein
LSTILDALRKVQRDRDRESPDLRHALTQEEVQSGGFGPLHWLVVVGLVVLAVGASAYLFVDGERPGESIPGELAEVRRGTLVAASDGERAARKRADPQAGAQLGELSHGTREERRELRKSLDPRDERDPTMSEERRKRIARVIRRKEATRRAAEAAEFQELAEATVAAPAPDSEFFPDPELTAAVTPEPEPVPAGAAQPEPVTARQPQPEPVKPPEPVARTEPEPVRVAAVEREPAREPVPDSGSVVSGDPWAVRFPDLRLEAVRWHPDSSRREARLLVDSTRSVAAREGDVIVGVAVHRIDPGAVELRLGETVRLIRIGQ